MNDELEADPELSAYRGPLPPLTQAMAGAAPAPRAPGRAAHDRLPRGTTAASVEAALRARVRALQRENAALSAALAAANAAAAAAAAAAVAPPPPLLSPAMTTKTARVPPSRPRYPSHGSKRESRQQAADGTRKWGTPFKKTPSFVIRHHSLKSISIKYSSSTVRGQHQHSRLIPFFGSEEIRQTRRANSSPWPPSACRWAAAARVNSSASYKEVSPATGDVRRRVTHLVRV